MKKIIETVAEGGGELGVHMYPFVLKTFNNFTFTLLQFGYYNTCVASSCMNPEACHTCKRLVFSCLCAVVLIKIARRFLNSPNSVPFQFLGPHLLCSLKMYT